MSYIFNTFFYQPIFNLLVFLYNIIPGHDLGVAIILLTIIIKLALLPLSKQSIKSQKAMQELQPKIDEIKVKYPKKEEQAKAMMELYKNEKINPFSSCLPLLIQLPFLWAVFKVFRAGLSNGSLNMVYSFLHRPEALNPIFFGFLNLSVPNIYLAVLAGAAQFWQAKMLPIKKSEVKGEGTQDESMTVIMNKQMIYFMPLLTFFMCLKFPAGLALYWFVTTMLTAAQQIYIFKHKD